MLVVGFPSALGCGGHAEHMPLVEPYVAPLADLSGLIFHGWGALSGPAV